MKKFFAESILTVIFAPMLVTFVCWFGMFVINTYQAMATVANQAEDIKEIKTDIKETKTDIKVLLLRGN